MSACAGLGIDNLVIDITAEEVPILDGSAGPFVAAMEEVGLVAASAPRKYLKILKTILMITKTTLNQKAHRVHRVHKITPIAGMKTIHLVTGTVHAVRCVLTGKKTH